MSEPSEKIAHVYDDIREEDNHLPNWWLAILFGSMVFGFGYWLVYHTTKSLPNPNAEYAADVAALEKARAAASPLSEASLLALASDPKAIEDGRAVFVSTCAACHGQRGEGLVGPNLTDKFWIHGNKPAELAKSVTEGYADKGMPAWGKTLGDDKIRKVLAYVMSLKNTNVAGKAPQGDPLD